MDSVTGDDPARNPDVDLTLVLRLICFHDWCQDQIDRAMMMPADRSTYAELTWNFFLCGTPYVEFRHQMVELQQNYRHLQVYWDVFHSWSMGRAVLADYSLFFYPVYLCRRMDVIPTFANIIFGDTELWDRAPQWSQSEARQLAAQPAAELARQLNFQALAEANPRLYSYP